MLSEKVLSPNSFGVCLCRKLLLYVKGIVHINVVCAIMVCIVIWMLLFDPLFTRLQALYWITSLRITEEKFGKADLSVPGNFRRVQTPEKIRDAPHVSLEYSELLASMLIGWRNNRQIRSYADLDKLLLWCFIVENKIIKLGLLSVSQRLRLFEKKNCMNGGENLKPYSTSFWHTEFPRKNQNFPLLFSITILSHTLGAECGHSWLFPTVVCKFQINFAF